MRLTIPALLASLSLLVGLDATAQQVLVEAEGFSNHGGWVVDTQFIQLMGSPYLLAHGMGEPVKDATTTVALPGTGTYRVFVRTKDWVAPWKASGAPGKFQVLVNGEPLKETFGTKGPEWAWQDGGKIEVSKTEIALALHDLTGFEGRCDAILFSKDSAFNPPNDSAPLAVWRKQLLGLPEKPVDGGSFDLVVVGGGYGGLGAAVSAARMGCKVALIQDRPVLGGNGSSEIRVWAQGGTRRGLYPNLGEIVQEFSDRAKTSPGTYEEYEDAKKERLVRNEKNISLFLNHHVFGVQKDGNRVVGVIAIDTRTSAERRFTGKLFADCTGHATIGFLAGADHTIKEEGHMGMSNMWMFKDTGSPQSFPEVPWALDLSLDDFPYSGLAKRGHAEWFWESGFNKHPIKDLELTRDWNFRAAYGAFNALKRKDPKNEHANAKLEWLAYIGGPRESRQLLGDVVLTRDDIDQKKPFPDGCVPTTWDIDLHYPKEQYAKKFPENPFISRAQMDKSVDRKHGYPVPYRCFYSRNIDNLFMAGRCVSVTHEALGTVRVMKTGGMIGEVVGKAASICLAHNCSPRDVYHSYLGELKELMNLRGIARRDSVNGKVYVPSNAPVLPPANVKWHDPATMGGIVIDDDKAKLTGNWHEGEGLQGFIGTCYRYLGAKAKGTARFEFSVAASGKYEVRWAYQQHENRASNAAVTVHSADGDAIVRVNEKVRPPVEPTFVSLGEFQFVAGQPAYVEVTTAGADGTVAIDAVQILRAK